MEPISQSLLPISARVAEDGHLSIGGSNLCELAEEFGTPLFVYDEEHLRTQCREAVTAFGNDNVVYASKAFLCLAMARVALEEGLQIDVATLGELEGALRAGYPGERIVMHGNNKNDAMLRRCLEVGVGRIVVDNFDELDHLEKLHAEGMAAPQVLIRINPGVEVHTHEYISTGVTDSKFGFSLEHVEKAVELATASSAMELVGLHAHIGSQIFNLENYGHATSVVANIAKQFGLPELSLGGGLGVAYLNGETNPSWKTWADTIHTAVNEAGLDARISVEPGRAIVGTAGVTLYTVGVIKNVPDVRTYVAVDGGMSDNPRPELYGAGYETFLPRSADAVRPFAARVVGEHCESGDILVREANLPEDVQVGDVLCTPVTGAYGYSMASNYNKVMRPAVVFVKDGKARVVVRRETLDDLYRNDSLPI